MADLLVAQTEMLRSISAQLAIVNQGVQLILAGVEQLKILVRDLPTEVVRHLASSELQASFITASEKFDRAATLRERYGMEHALRIVAPDAALNLAKLENSRAVLMGDSSPLVVSLVCACWYVEFQILASLVPFEPGRIASIARSYQRYLESTTTRIANLLVETNAQAAVVLQAQQRIVGDAGTICYGPISYPSPNGRCSVDQFGFPRCRMQITRHAIQYRLTDHFGETLRYAAEFTKLEQISVAVDPVYKTLRPLTGGIQTESVPFETSMGGPGRTEGDRWVRRQNDAPCPDPMVMTERTKAMMRQEMELAMAKGLSHYHFHLAAREAMTSVRSILKRVT